MRVEYQTPPLPTLQQLQDEAFRVFNSCGNLLVTKRMRVALTVAAGATRIAHGMRAVPEDVLVGIPSTLSLVWQPQAPDAQFIYLQTTDDCSVTVWLP